MITNVLKQKIINKIVDSINCCSYTINGESKRKEIFRIISDEKSFNVKVRFDDSDEGEIENLKILDLDNDVILINDNKFNKPANKSIVVSFNFNDIVEVID